MSRWSTPLDWLEVPGCEGLLGMMACPGGAYHRGPQPASGEALDIDVLALKAARVHTLVSLVEAFEFERLNVTALPQHLQRRGIAWLHLPITDMRSPDEAFELGWSEHGPSLHALLAAGENVVLHCWAGLGRTGTIAARLLVEGGCEPSVAIARVRGARRGAIQSPEQERHLMLLPFR